MAQEDVFKKIVSHCKEYGFVFPSSEIYDGLGAVYDYGQLGVELKNNIKQYWWQSMTLLHENIVGIDSAIFMHPTIWKASGHVDAFNDPLIDNKDSKKRYRADVLIEDQLAKYDEKIEKEVAKGRKRFKEAFNEEEFRATNGRVLEIAAKRAALHERFAQLSMIVTSKNCAKSSWMRKSFAPSAVLATGLRCANLTSCLRLKWALPLRGLLLSTSALRQHKVFS